MDEQGNSKIPPRLPDRRSNNIFQCIILPEAQLSVSQNVMYGSLAQCILCFNFAFGMFTYRVYGLGNGMADYCHSYVMLEGYIALQSSYS